MTSGGQTPSQTVGPYFAYGLTPEQYGYPLKSIAHPTVGGLDSAGGPRILVEGRVLDGNGDPVDDAMIEIWQADAQGRYPGTDTAANSAFTGFARCGTGTDRERRFIFETVKPGAAEDGQAPHINVIVFARGLLSHAYTRIYFADEAAANEADPVLAAVPEPRRGTLIATRHETDRGVVYRFDIHLQGAAETVFFDV
ncbi:MAG: protocatechuate 3,4-dioxygenase subunit alpha [Alphaproteobacteria bacterium]|nr:protocatechuate 3,4-dioxygenase subunit alpha [Alphaproteobacteria bacterium]